MATEDRAFLGRIWDWMLEGGTRRFGYLIGLLIVIPFLILGGFYFFGPQSSVRIKVADLIHHSYYDNGPHDSYVLRTDTGKTYDIDSDLFYELAKGFTYDCRKQGLDVLFFNSRLTSCDEVAGPAPGKFGSAPSVGESVPGIPTGRLPKTIAARTECFKRAGGGSLGSSLINGLRDCLPDSVRQKFLSCVSSEPQPYSVFALSRCLKSVPLR